jgi:tRNA G18 (ribose-2'-O)-methylase SpoU
MDLKSKGYKVYAVEQAEGSMMLSNFNTHFTEPIALVFGNEVEGVATDVIAICDGCIEIPQEGMKHSFNISVAAGIVLWEMVRTKQSNM